MGLRSRIVLAALLSATNSQRSPRKRRLAASPFPRPACKPRQADGQHAVHVRRDRQRTSWSAAAGARQARSQVAAPGGALRGPARHADQAYHQQRRGGWGRSCQLQTLSTRRRRCRRRRRCCRRCWRSLLPAILLHTELQRKPLKEGIANFYDESSQLWENIWVRWRAGCAAFHVLGFPTFTAAGRVTCPVRAPAPEDATMNCA